MKFDFHTIVIGAGSAGLMTAGILSNLGATVALIEKNKMGGDCLNTGCVPSKALLYHAENQRKYSFGSHDAETEAFSNVMKGIHHTIDQIAPHDSVERFEEMGVNVFEGHGKLLDPHRVEVAFYKGKQMETIELTGKNIVIATGSRPRVPDLEGLSTISYLTNETLFHLEKLPERLVIWGGGPISMEIGQAFSRLGSDVSVILRGNRLFKKDEPEVHEVMKDLLEKDGITFYFGYEPMAIRKMEKENKAVHEQFQILMKQRETGVEKSITADRLLLALGREATTENLGLENAGVERDQRDYVKVNRHLQTSRKNIFACGDILGDFQFTHMAGYEAEIVTRNLMLPVKTKAEYSKAVWTTYTKPQVAHSGHTETSAKEAGKLGKVLVKSSQDVDRSMIEGDTAGFAKLILDRRGRIIGGTIVSNEAGEMITGVSLAIRKKLKLGAFQSLIYSYPTKSEIFKALAVDNLQDSVKPWQRNLIKKWLGRSINRER